MACMENVVFACIKAENTATTDNITGGEKNANN